MLLWSLNVVLEGHFFTDYFVERTVYSIALFLSLTLKDQTEIHISEFKARYEGGVIFQNPCMCHFRNFVFSLHIQTWEWQRLQNVKSKVCISLWTKTFHIYIYRCTCKMLLFPFFVPIDLFYNKITYMQVHSTFYINCKPYHL